MLDSTWTMYGVFSCADLKGRADHNGAAAAETQSAKSATSRRPAADFLITVLLDTGPRWAVGCGLTSATRGSAISEMAIHYDGLLPLLTAARASDGLPPRIVQLILHHRPCVPVRHDIRRPDLVHVHKIRIAIREVREVPPLERHPTVRPRAPVVFPHRLPRLPKHVFRVTAPGVLLQTLY